MKTPTIIILSCMLLLCITGSAQNRILSLAGEVYSEDNNPVAFATVGIFPQNDSTTVYSRLTDDHGAFHIQLLRGSYKLTVTFLGMSAFTQVMDLTESVKLDRIIMKQLPVGLEGAVVTGKFIVRKSDRYIVNVGGTMLPIGKSTSELLSLIPGIWIQEHEGVISINGKSGTRVMLNDRILHETGADLIATLSLLNAEDIQRIEVIPTTGADEDADRKGGMIKIITKTIREDGLEGSVSMRSSLTTSHANKSLRPGLSLSYRNKNFSTYLMGGYDNYDFYNLLTEQNNFILSNTSNSIVSEVKRNNVRSGDIRWGSLYELDKKQSVGLEVTYGAGLRPATTVSRTDQHEGSQSTAINTLFENLNRENSLSFSANYVNKLDTLGSTFKVLLDYNRNGDNGNQDFYSIYSGSRNFDTTYYDINKTRYQIYVARADLEWKFSSTASMQVGAKFTHNQMDNRIRYEALSNDSWQTIDRLSNTNAFSENIGALYISYSKTIPDKISMQFGLRGEYTNALPWNSNVEGEIQRQNYFSLFPSANLAVPLNQKNSQTLILSYARKISRPSFSLLNPFRFPISEVSYDEGNPRLKPSYLNDYSLSWVVNQTYDMTIGIVDTKDGIQSLIIPEKENSDILVERPENIASSLSYYITLNLPIHITDWWQMNVNLLGKHTRLKIAETSLFSNEFEASMSNSFKLSKIFSLNINGYYTSPYLDVYTRYSQEYVINASLSAKLLKDRITASIFGQNLTNFGYMTYETKQPDLLQYSSQHYRYRSVGVSVRYNFKAGKGFKIRHVESGADEEKERL